MSDLLVFASIGLLTGAAVRAWFPKREPAKIAETMLLGMLGSLLGGTLSWAMWSSLVGQLYTTALVMSFLGGVLVLMVWGGIVYARIASVPTAHVN